RPPPPSPPRFPYTTLFRSAGGGAAGLALALPPDAAQLAGYPAERAEQAEGQPGLEQVPGGPQPVRVAGRGTGGLRLQFASERLADRKSTRLNSSHRTTSYA